MVSITAFVRNSHGEPTLFILIDNYDSFTWNLWHFVSDLGAEVEIVRNNAVSADDIIARNPEGIIVSPGPGTPENAGIVMELILAAKRQAHRFLAFALGIKPLLPPLVPPSSALIRQFTVNCP